MSRAWMPRAVFIASIVTAPSVLAADAPPKEPSAEELSTARRLFGDGLRAEDAGDWEAALDIFLRIEQITTSPLVRYHVGLCHEHLGRWVEALNAFELAASEAERAGKPDVAREARAHIAAVSPKTARLQIEVPEGLEGLELSIDGKPVNAALAGAPVLVDPGERRVVARAKGRARSFDATVTVAEGATEIVKVDLGPPVAEPPPTRDGPAGAGDAGSGDGPLGLGTHFVPFAIVGGAALALGVGALATGLAAHGKHDDYVAANDAPAPGSLGERRALRDDGQALGLASTLLTGGAAIAAGVAAYFFFTAPPSPGERPASEAALHVTPWAAAGAGGVVVRGQL